MGHTAVFAEGIEHGLALHAQPGFEAAWGVVDAGVDDLGGGGWGGGIYIIYREGECWVTRKKNVFFSHHMQ